MRILRRCGGSCAASAGISSAGRDWASSPGAYETDLDTDTRVIVLEEIIAKGDPAGFETFRVRVANHGIVPAGQSPTAAGYSATAGYRPNSMAPGGGAKNHADGGASRRELRASFRDMRHADVRTVNFRSSCFYEKLEPVLKPQDLPGRLPFPQTSFLRTTYQMLIQVAQRCLRTATPYAPNSD